MNLIKRKDGESRRGKYRAVFDITDATWKRHLDAPRSFGRLFIGELSGEESGGGGRRIGENTALNAVNQQVRRARRRRANKGGREGKTLEGFTGGGRAIYLPAGLFLF